MEFFPGEEPQHTPLIDSKTSPSFVSRLSGFETYKGIRPSTSALHRTDPRRRSSEATRHSDVVPEEQYINLERTMEFKAISKGGDKLRREFFQFLNKTRHDINEQHPLCSRGAKAHVVDVLVWNQFCKSLSIHMVF
jgi:hypothetical protein